MSDSLVSTEPFRAGDLRPSHNPVWVHSSFRVSSTWFWSRFRRLPNVVAYQEIFHELLGSLTPERAATFSYRDWDSGHPPSAPYFLEYAPFLREGWLKCDDRLASGSFIPKSIDRSIECAEVAHIEKLIDKASASRRTPVLTDVRTLGRVHGLWRHFGGFHILLHRNLFRQWCSYSGQELRGNAYFINQTDQVISQNTHDAFLATLSTMFPSAPEERKCCSWEHFLRFTLFHLYVYALALPDCGLDVCIERLATHPEYRGAIEEQIEAATGLSVDLTGCQQNIELSTLPFDGRQREALETMRIVAGAIPAFLPGWSSRQQRFLDAQICALEAELDRYVFYSQAVVRYASAGFADLAAAREAAQGFPDAARERDQLASQVADLETRMASLGEECEKLRQRAETGEGAAAGFEKAAAGFEKMAEESRAETERSAAEVRELAGKVRLLQEELNASTRWKDEVGRLRDALAAVQRSTSWRVTAPLRTLKRLALREG